MLLILNIPSSGPYTSLHASFCHLYKTNKRHSVDTSIVHKWSIY